MSLCRLLSNLLVPYFERAVVVVAFFVIAVRKLLLFLLVSIRCRLFGKRLLPQFGTMPLVATTLGRPLYCVQILPMLCKEPVTIKVNLTAKSS